MLTPLQIIGTSDGIALHGIEWPEKERGRKSKRKSIFLHWIIEIIQSNESCKLLMKARIKFHYICIHWVYPLIHKTKTTSIHFSGCSNIRTFTIERGHKWMNFPWFCVRIWAHAFCQHSPLHPNHFMYGHGKFGVTFCFFSNWSKCVCARVESNFGPSPSYHPPNGIIQSYEQRILKITPPICSFHYVEHKKWKKLFFSLKFFIWKNNQHIFDFIVKRQKFIDKFDW